MYLAHIALAIWIAPVSENFVSITFSSKILQDKFCFVRDYELNEISAFDFQFLFWPYQELSNLRAKAYSALFIYKWIWYSCSSSWFSNVFVIQHKFSCNITRKRGVCPRGSGNLNASLTTKLAIVVKPVIFSNLSYKLTYSSAI